ncbi:hypothetical protein [Clostridium algidicarnis]|nr:hypothetical protein [Clostridium algidicarnis]MBU3203581.1 hypothetical protein [Clostridium algidicarnis]MBU3211735.1 hypothetical protein [Clostridium algidicarnis]
MKIIDTALNIFPSPITVSKIIPDIRKLLKGEFFKASVDIAPDPVGLE